MENPKLLKVHDLARWLQVSEARVYELVRQNLIPAVRVGRQVRFEAGQVEAWIGRGGGPAEDVSLLEGAFGEPNAFD